LLAGGLLLGVAACGGETEATSGQSISIRALEDIDTWDPHVAASTSSMFWLGPVYEGLVRTTPDGDYAPLLAEKFEYEDSGKKLVFHLRKDVKFSDGEALSAEAVKGSLDRAMTFKDSQYGGDMKEVIKRTVVVDENTVELDLTPDSAGVLDTLAGAAGVVVSPKTLAGADIATKPVGTGPYVLTTHRRDQEIDFTANDTYWGGKPGVESLKIKVIPSDSTAVSALGSGEVDIVTEAQSVLSTAVVEQARSMDGVKVSAPGGAGVFEITLNRAPRSPFADARVRQAIYQAIDIDGLLKVLPGATKSVQYAVPSSPFAVEGLEDRFSYDPENSRRLLSQAGLADGLSFEMRVIDAGSYVPLSEFIKANLAKVGIDVRLRVTELASFREDCTIEQSCESTLTRVKLSADPVVSARSRVLSGESSAWGEIPEASAAAYSKAAASSDAETHEEAVRAFSTAYAEDYQNILLAAQPVSLLANEKVGEIDVNFNGIPQWASIAKR